MTDLRIAEMSIDWPGNYLAVALLEATVACPNSKATHQYAGWCENGQDVDEEGTPVGTCTVCKGKARVYWLDPDGEARLRKECPVAGYRHPDTCPWCNSRGWMPSDNVGAWMEAALAMTGYKPPACIFVSVRQEAYQVELGNVLEGVNGVGLGPTVYDALIRAFYAAATTPPKRISGLGQVKE